MDEPAPIPVVRLGEALHEGSPHAAEVAHDMAHALETAGAVYIRDHGIPDDLLVEQFDAAEALFDLPHEQRATLVRRVHDESSAHWSEAPRDCFECCTVKAVGLGREPARVVLRGEPPEWLVPTLESYVNAMSRLSRRCLELLTRSLDDRPPGPFGGCDGEAVGVLRLLRYAACSCGGPVAAGAQAHTDRSALTLLAQDAHPGLELELPDGRWATVLPCPGALLLHPGDLLSAWSDGRLRSPRHRVRRSAQQVGTRLSMPFFYTPLRCAYGGESFTNTSLNALTGC